MPSAATSTIISPSASIESGVQTFSLPPRAARHAAAWVVSRSTPASRTMAKRRPRRVSPIACIYPEAEMMQQVAAEDRGTDAAMCPSSRDAVIDDPALYRAFHRPHAALENETSALGAAVAPADAAGGARSPATPIRSFRRGPSDASAAKSGGRGSISTSISPTT